MGWNPNCLRFDLTYADMLVLMGGYPPPEQEGPSQDAYFNLVSKRVRDQYGPDAEQSIWLLASGDCEPWDSWTRQVAHKNTMARHKEGKA